MKKTKKGFTLVELVIVVAVMAVLVAVAIPTVGAITQRAKDSVAASNAQTIESMIKLAEAKVSETQDLGAQIIFDALDDADLGIADGIFLYDSNTGVCEAKTSAPTLSAGQYSITFSSTATNPLTVTQKGGGAAGEGGVATDLTITEHSEATE